MNDRRGDGGGRTPVRSEVEEPPAQGPTASAEGGDANGRRWTRVALALAGAAVVAFLLIWYVVIPFPWGLQDHAPDRTALMEQRLREAEAAEEPFEIRQEWVPLDEISPHLVRAVVVAEDYRFRQHTGVDWVSIAEEVEWTGDDTFSWASPSDLRALWRAVRYAWTNRAEVKGRSTLTQQLAKNLYFGTERSFLRKGIELAVAGRLERRLGKDRILELYLNVAEWGPGIFGAEAAAQAYFGRSASSVTRRQAAALAGTLPHPLSSNPAHRPGRMRWRQEMILERLEVADGVPIPPMPISEPDFELEMEIPLPDVPAPASPLAPDPASGDPESADSLPPDSAGVASIDTTGTRRDATY
jgi:monofunctional biosynthetic peptidoglycan transglycosylase